MNEYAPKYTQNFVLKFDCFVLLDKIRISLSNEMKCMYVCMYVCTCMYVCMYVHCMYVCMYVSIYLSIYMYVHVSM